MKRSQPNAIDMGIDTVVFNNPLLLAALVAALSIIAYLQKRLGPGDDWVPPLRLRLLKLFDGWATEEGRPLTRQKSIEEYVFSVRGPPDQVEQWAHAYGYERNLPSTKKYRHLPDEDGKQWAYSSWKYTPPESNEMHHLYIFPGHGNKGTDCYHHVEIDWEDDPEGHVNGERTPGDKGGHLRRAARRAYVTVLYDEGWVEKMKRHQY